MKRWLRIFLILACVGLSACSNAGGDFVLFIDGKESMVTKVDYTEIEEKVNVNDDEDFSLLLEYLFYKMGVKAVDEVTLITEESAQTFSWDEIADSTYWRNTRQIEIHGEEYIVDQVAVTTEGFEEDAEHSITDIAPLTAEALGISFGERESGFDIQAGSYEHVVWFFLDGFGYEGFQAAKSEGLIPYLGSLGEMFPSYTIYPPRTSTSTAALLSGLDSQQNGVWATGIRNLGVPSIVDALIEVGRGVTIVEGSSTPFNYPNAVVILSGDRNGDGSTDDNVLMNAKETIANGVDELLMIHFHGIDDAGHTYGPYSPQWNAKIPEIDSSVEQLIELLPAKTLVIIFPDHGMHSVENDTSLGNHGNLIFEDMGTYIILYQK